MANTLETKTVEQLLAALQSYNSYMCDIPEQFPVFDEYLHGITVPEFCSAFKLLQKIVTDIYTYLYDNPQSVGLVMADKKIGELKVQTSQHISCVKKLLYTIGRFSKLGGNILNIPMELMINAYMTYYPNCSVELAETLNLYDVDKQNKFFETKHMRSLFECLSTFGFVIDGLNSNLGSLQFSYPDNPAVIIALKAFSSPNICRSSFGFDFTKFNYRIFAHPSNAKIPLEDLYSYNLLSDENKHFLSMLNKTLNDLGADYGECESGWYHGTLPCQYIYRNKVRIMQNIESGLIANVVVRFGQKVDRMAKFIESLPEKYHDRIAKCGSCRKGDCNHRIPVATAGKKYMICNIAWWGFPPSVEAVPYIVGAFKI